MLLGGAAAWPLAARAQQERRQSTVGFLGATTPAADGQRFAAFVQRLRELGWVEGRNFTLVVRWAEGRSERFTEIAAELVRLKVDVILTHTTPPLQAAKQATSTIPIVFATAGDPVAIGIVASLARPGGNVTGLSSQAPDTVGKRLELLRQVLPDFRRLAILANVGSPYAVLELNEVQSTVRTLGLAGVAAEIGQTRDIAPTVMALKGHVDALYVIPDPLTSSNRIGINILAVGARLPTMWTVRELAEAGGLMSYGTNWLDQFRRAGDYVDKILRGTNPADLPVEQPTKFDLVINMFTARALDLEIPTTLLATADEVIE